MSAEIHLSTFILLLKVCKDVAKCSLHNKIFKKNSFSLIVHDLVIISHHLYIIVFSIVKELKNRLYLEKRKPEENYQNLNGYVHTLFL